MKSEIGSVIITIIVLCIGNFSCATISNENPDRLIRSVRPAKWFKNHSCAVSVTCDIPSHLAGEVVNEIVNRSLTADFEMVTSAFTAQNKDLQRRVESYYARGIRFFGHGHEHYFFDTMSYEVAYSMFDTCYQLMEEWNLGPPFSYCYPYGAGSHPIPQKAVADAGFICARGVCFDMDTFLTTGKYFDSESLFICPGTQQEPSNWFNLPSVCVGFYVPGWVNTHNAMAEMFDRNEFKNAWLILMYHSIGLKSDPGYYPIEDFRKDLDDLAASDVWVSNMDVIARYIHERNNCRISYRITDHTEDECMADFMVWDTLDTPYDKVPLTLLIELQHNTPFTRCEVITPDGTSMIQTIIDNSLALSVVPDGTVAKLRFYPGQ